MCKWKQTGATCNKCGRELELRPDYLNWTGLIIRGFEPMKYQHADGYDGHKAEVYTDCGKYKEWMTCK